MISSQDQQQSSELSVERQIAKSIAFFRCVGRLKHTARQGWVERRVTPQPPEAVASHMWRMAVMAMLLPSHRHLEQPAQSSDDNGSSSCSSSSSSSSSSSLASLDRDRMIRMSLVHDVCETIVGDATPAMKVPKEVKAQAEDDAVTHVLAPLLPLLGGKEIVDLFHEYEANETPEAKFVHDLDLLDMVLQAVDYKRSSSPETDLLSFMDSAKRVQHPFLKKVTEHVIDLFFDKKPEEEVPVPETNLLK